MRNFLFNSLCFIIAMSLVFGWYWPLVTVHKFFIFSNSVSVFGAISTLWVEGYWLLLTLLVFVSIVMPLGKLSLLVLSIYRANPKTLIWLHHLGKWSFTDVFIVAFLVVVLKLDGMVTVTVELGFYCFVTSALLSYAVGLWLHQLAVAKGMSAERVNPTP